MILSHPAEWPARRLVVTGGGGMCGGTAVAGLVDHPPTHPPTQRVSINACAFFSRAISTHLVLAGHAVRSALGEHG